MMPRAVATIGVRIIAVLLMLQGLFGTINVIRAFYVASAHSSSAAATVLAPEGGARDSAQIAAAIRVAVPSVLAHLGVGGVLLLVSKPLGRLLARGVG